MGTQKKAIIPIVPVLKFVFELTATVHFNCICIKGIALNLSLNTN